MSFSVRSRGSGRTSVRAPTRDASETAPSPRLPTRGVVALLGVLALFCASFLVREGSGSSPVWDGVVGSATLGVSAVVCLLRARFSGPRRAVALWLGLGMASFTAGHVIDVGWTQFQAEPSVPSPADIAYLAIYPCLAVALLLLIKREAGGMRRAVWIDGALGAAGAATALAVVLDPVLAGIEGDLAEVLVGAAYPVADLLLIATITGLVAVRGARRDPLCLWLMAGLATFCAADVVYALRVAADSYAIGTALDLMWPVGLAIVAFGVWQPERPSVRPTATSTAVLFVAIVATLVAVAALVVASFGGLSGATVALATSTLLLAVLRTFVSFREVQRLSDAGRRAVTDELTGLGNRRYLFEAGARRLRSVSPTARVALVLVDLDNFKEVNDALGHQTGDDLLRVVARRLAASVRAPDLLLRLGGDEFALVIALAEGEDGHEAARAVLDGLDDPIEINGARLSPASSAGVAVTGDAAATIAELLRRADVAMYVAKRAGSCIVLFEERFDQENRERLEVVADLSAALAECQFVLHYQPKVDVGTGQLAGVEALVRWQHPTRGLLFPDAFLPQLQRSGQMAFLTRLVLEAAVAQIAGWRASGLVITVAVNVSASDLLDPELVGRVAELLARHDVPSSLLAIEITESDLMTEPERARDALDRLRRLGLSVAVDDYGTGYCALAYLHRLAVDEIKIDRTFVARIATDPRSAIIVRSTIELAHDLGLVVVAEGVEDEAALEVLGGFGCDLAQGFHYSRAVPAPAFELWARAREAPVRDAPEARELAFTRREP